METWKQNTLIYIYTMKKDKKNTEITIQYK